MRSDLFAVRTSVHRYKTFVINNVLNEYLSSNDTEGSSLENQIITINVKVYHTQNHHYPGMLSPSDLRAKNHGIYYYFFFFRV